MRIGTHDRSAGNSRFDNFRSGVVKILRALAAAVLLTSCAAAALSAADRDAIFREGAKAELLWSDGEFTEGVVSAPDGQIYFSDIAGKVPGRILKFNPRSKMTTVHSADSGKSNGLTFDAQGRLIACCGAAGGLRAVCRVSSSGVMEPIISKFEGKLLNAPNDLDIHPRGWIFFSDPRYGSEEGMELDHMSVYRYDPATKKLARVTTDVTKPNGVVLSPDGRTLYVAETDNGAPVIPGGGKVRMTLNAFPVDDEGNLGAKRVLKDYGQETGVDGMTVDAQGRIFAAVRAESRYGIAVYDPAGTEVAFLETPEVPTNCGFGRGEDRSVLYLTAGKSLYRVRTGTEGWFAF
jgi:gluconolactonase